MSIPTVIELRWSLSDIVSGGKVSDRINSDS